MSSIKLVVPIRAVPKPFKAELPATGNGAGALAPQDAREEKPAKSEVK